MEGTLQRLNVRVVHASRMLSRAAVGALLLVCGAVLIDVSLRWFFNQPVHGLEDITSLIITVAVAACFPAGFALRTNITVHAAGKMLGPRAHAWMDTFGHAVTFCFIALATWQLAIYTTDVVSRKSLILGLPVAPAWYAAVGFLALAALAQASVLAARLAAAVQAGKHRPD